MNLVVVDRVSRDFVAEVAKLLSDSGLHPRYDDLPRYVLKYDIPTMHSRVRIYVPADEAERAKQILAAYYEETERLSSERLSKLPPLHDAFVTPALVSIVLGVAVALIGSNPGYGIAAWLVSFLIAIPVVSYWRSR
jgi:hypothetical protein